MLSFACICRSHRFSLPDEEAGTTVQCPVCKRLVDVPTPQDLLNADADGLPELAPEQPRVVDDAATLRELHRVWGKEKFDEAGRPIDLRDFDRQIEAAGSYEPPLQLREQLPPGRPHYDPDTGELLEPIDVKPLPPQRVLPMGTVIDPDMRRGGMRSGVIGPGASPEANAMAQAKGTLPYRNERIINGPKPLTQPADIAAKLLLPMNVFVWLIMFACLAAGSLITTVFLPRGAIVNPVAVLGWVVVLAHYAHCLIDLGPGELDELPRPLGEANPWEDFIVPLSELFLSAALTLGPAAVVYGLTFVEAGGATAAAAGGGQAAGGGGGGAGGGPILPVFPFRTLVAGPMAAIGLFFFPAVLLICCTSGSIANLRPDRVVRTVGVFGSWYFVVVLAVVVCAALSLGVVPSLALSAITVLGIPVPTGPTAVVAQAAALFAAVYFGHLAVWMLASLYRTHQDDLPWAFQAYDRARAQAKLNAPSNEKTRRATLDPTRLDSL